jgi:hypothetical protein
MAACHAHSPDNNFGSSSAGINRIKFVGFGYFAISALACTPERGEVYGPRAAAVKCAICVLANPLDAHPCAEIAFIKLSKPPCGQK